MTAGQISRWEAGRVGWQRWAILRLRRWAVRHGRDEETPRHLLVGERGELEALFFLRREGFVVVERRWRAPEVYGDLDLVAWEGETLCFVEVKTRTARDRTPAAAAVDDEKRRMLSKMARAYLRTLPREEREAVRVRFDVVSVYLVGGEAECELVRDVRVDDSAGFGV